MGGRERLRLLLDTHALIWFLAGDPKLSRRTRAQIEDETSVVLVSAVSAIEVKEALKTK